MANFFDRINPFKIMSQLGGYGGDFEDNTPELKSKSQTVPPDVKTTIAKKSKKKTNLVRSKKKISIQPEVLSTPTEVQPMPQVKTASVDLKQEGDYFTEVLAKKRGVTVEQFLALQHQPINDQKKIDTVVVELFPSWPDDQRCAPNEILRSSLFAVVKKGERVPIQSQLIAAWGDDEIYFTGVQLDQYDLDVWLQCLHFYRKTLVGTKVYFTFRGFLKELGKSPSGQNLRALKESLDRLQAGGIKLRNGSAKKSYTGSLIDKYYEDEELDMWCLVINPDLLPLFNSETTWINWKIRKELSGNLTKWLAGWASTHEAQASAPQKIKLENIQKFSGCRYATKHHLKSDVVKSLKELQEKAVIKSWEFDKKDTLSVVRSL